MAQNDTQTFLTYWRSLRPETDQAPERGAFDPVKVRSLVPQLMMLSARDGFRFRLAGEVVERMHGLGLKECDFSRLFDPEHQAAVVAALTAARYREQALRLTTLTRVGEETLEIECLLAPLRTNGLITRFVGLYAPLSPLPATFQDEALFEDSRPLAGRMWLTAAELIDDTKARSRSQLRLIVLNGREVA